MKLMIKFFGLITLAVMMGFSFVVCSSPSGGGETGPGGNAPELSGAITITPNSSVGIGTELTAHYSGSETITLYQWKRGATNVGTNSNTYTPDAAGSYTVTVSAAGYKSKTSAAVIVMSGSGTNADPFRLTADKWTDGIITSVTNEVWYSFDVIAGTTYRVWWNDSYSSTTGDGSKTLDIKVSGYHSDETSITGFTDSDTAWSTAKSFTPSANDTVLLKVVPYTPSYTGTFGIVYSTGSTRPPVPINPQSPIPLIADQWKDGYVPEYGQVWYTFNVAAGTTYRVWWNESGNTFGDGSKSLDVYVSAYYSDGTSIFIDADSAWATPRTITPTANGTVYLKVKYWGVSGQSGTFGIVYSTGTTRPTVPAFSPPATPLTADQWEDGEITTTPNGEAWYSFPVTSGSTYYVWWNDSYSGYSGNRLKTLDIAVSAHTGNGAFISGFSNVDSAWDTVKTYNATADGTIYLVVRGKNPANTGTFGIAYSETSTRPPMSITIPGAIPLTATQWENSEISANSNGEVWYSFPVTSGTTFRIYGNDGYSASTGNGTKTLPAMKLSAWYSYGTNVFYDRGTAWISTNDTYTPTANGTVYVKVYPSPAGATGTFGIVYTTGSSRPNVTFDPNSLPNLTELTVDHWEDSEITATIRNAWYSFTATAATQYIHFSIGTLNDLDVQMYSSTGSTVGTSFSPSSSYPSYSQTLTVGETYYIRVRPSSTSNSGTYQIAFNGSSTAPPITIPSSYTVLTADAWANGNIPTSGGQEWFQFTATAATQYIHFSTVGTLKDVYVQVYDSGGNTVGGATNLYYSTLNTSRSLTADQTYYIRVRPYSSNGSGNYQIAFNTSTTAPTQ